MDVGDGNAVWSIETRPDPIKTKPDPTQLKKTDPIAFFLILFVEEKLILFVAETQRPKSADIKVKRQH